MKVVLRVRFWKTSIWGRGVAEASGGSQLKNTTLKSLGEVSRMPPAGQIFENDLQIFGPGVAEASGGSDFQKRP